MDKQSKYIQAGAPTLLFPSVLPEAFRGNVHPRQRRSFLLLNRMRRPGAKIDLSRVADLKESVSH